MTDNVKTPLFWRKGINETIFGVVEEWFHAGLVNISAMSPMAFPGVCYAAASHELQQNHKHFEIHLGNVGVGAWNAQMWTF